MVHNFLLIHRNRYSEGMDDGQKTSRVHPDFNSYVKIQRVFIDNGRRNTHALRGLEEPFFQLCCCVVSVFGSGGK